MAACTGPAKIYWRCSPRRSGHKALTRKLCPIDNPSQMKNKIRFLQENFTEHTLLRSLPMTISRWSTQNELSSIFGVSFCYKVSLSICLSIYLSVGRSVCLSIVQSIYQSIIYPSNYHLSYLTDPLSIYEFRVVCLKEFLYVQMCVSVCLLVYSVLYFWLCLFSVCFVLIGY